jgi:prepilin-type N-terminal cleavage/methylation domain-containing protein
MKSSNHSSSGFTLVEILTVLIITGILIGIAAPSLLSQQRVFKRAVGSIETLLKTTNLSARANSGNPYRITVATRMFNGKPEQTLKVEILQNGDCNPTTPLPAGQNWRHDVRKDFVLPEGVQITTFGPNGFPSTTASNGICFNGRGEVYGGQKSIDVVDTQNRSESVRARLTLSVVGDIARKTFRNNGTEIVGGALK